MKKVAPSLPQWIRDIGILAMTLIVTVAGLAVAILLFAAVLKIGGLL
ncbi:hypothetical protein [Caballeronia sp.]|jgi:hypothetical protein